VFDVCDRIVVMKNGKLVGTARVSDVTEEDVLGMIILGKSPSAPGARAAGAPGASPTE